MEPPLCSVLVSALSGADLLLAIGVGAPRGVSEVRF